MPAILDHPSCALLSSLELWGSVMVDGIGARTRPLRELKLHARHRGPLELRPMSGRLPYLTKLELHVGGAVVPDDLPALVDLGLALDVPETLVQLLHSPLAARLEALAVEVEHEHRARAVQVLVEHRAALPRLHKLVMRAYGAEEGALLRVFAGVYEPAIIDCPCCDRDDDYDDYDDY